MTDTLQITALSSIEAVNNTPLTIGTYTQPIGIPIYSAGSGTPQTPVLFLPAMNKSNPPQLKVTFTCNPTTTVQVAIVNGGCPNPNFRAGFQGIVTVPEGATSFTVLTSGPPLLPRPGPVLWQTPISWTVHLDDLGGPQVFSQGTYVELYTAMAEYGAPTDLTGLQLAAAAYLPQLYMPGYINPSMEQMTLVEACTQAAYAAPPAYSNAQMGNYFDYAAEDFDMVSWLLAVTKVTQYPQTAICYDCAAAVNAFIGLQSELTSFNVWGGAIDPFGWLTPEGMQLRGNPGQTRVNYFGDHLVAVVDVGAEFGPEFQYRVCDATIGPFTGGDTPQGYLYAACTSNSTPSAPENWQGPPTGTRPLQQPSSGAYYMITTVNDEPFPINPGKGGGAQSAAEGSLDAALPPNDLSRVDPLDEGNLQARFPGFSLEQTQSRYRYPVASRERVYIDGETMLRVHVWIASNGAQQAMEQYRWLCTASRFADRFEQVQGLGDAAAVLESGDTRSLLWVGGNRVVRLTTDKAGPDLMPIADWIEAQGRPTGIALPRYQASLSSHSAAIGETIALSIAAPANHVCDVVRTRPVCRPVQGDGKTVSLLAIAAGSTRLRVIVADPATLLVATPVAGLDLTVTGT